MKIKALPLLTLVEVEELVAGIADLEWARAESARDIAAKQAELDFQIAEVRKGFLPLIERLEAQLKAIDAKLNAKAIQVRAWALANPEKFVPQRSLVLTCGVIGFRRTPPRVETLSKRWTWIQCALALATLRWGRAYLKTPAVDKERLLADRDKLKARRRNLALAGLRIVQDDQFYVEPKAERDDALLAQRREAA